VNFDMLRLDRFRFTLRSLMATIGIIAVLIGGITLAMRTDSMQQLCWLGSQAFDICTYFLPRLTWAAGGGLLVALIAAASNKNIWHLRSLWLLTPLLVPIAILAYGIAFAYDGASPDIVERRVRILGTLQWLHLPIAVILICCLRSLWLVVIGISIAAAWFSIGASAVSYMSVTNIWL
jgi:hypothetical protein